MSMGRIKDTAVSFLEPTSSLINQELQDESTGESAGYLPQLATVKGFFGHWLIKISLRRSNVLPYH